MPIVTVAKITRPEHLIEYLAKELTESGLFKHIAKYNERLTPEYPAALITGGPSAKEVHGTHTFAVTLRADIYVLHAKLTEDYEVRSYNDMVLASKVVALLEGDMDLGERVIVGWVESETPGVSPPRSTRSEAVICTRMTYQAIQETRFK